MWGVPTWRCLNGDKVTYSFGRSFLARWGIWPGICLKIFENPSWTDPGIIMFDLGDTIMHFRLISTRSWDHLLPLIFDFLDDVVQKFRFIAPWRGKFSCQEISDCRGSLRCSHNGAKVRPLMGDDRWVFDRHLEFCNYSESNPVWQIDRTLNPFLFA